MYEFEKKKEDERLSRVNAVIGTIIKDNSDTKMISIKKDELCDILTKQMTHKELKTFREGKVDSRGKRIFRSCRN